MMKSLFTTILLTGFFSSISQEMMTISGHVSSYETGKALGFATIGIVGSPYGTISNTEGAFDFFIPRNFKSDSISISYVGYQTEKISLTAATTMGGLEVMLRESIIELETVEVNVEKLTAGQIIERALSKIDQNFPQDPFIIKGFFRDIRDQNNETVYLAEAALDVRDPGFALNKSLPKKFFIKGVRASELRINPLLSGSLLNSGNSLIVNLEHNYWLNKLKYISSRNEFIIEDIVPKGDRSLYVISTKELSSKSDLAEKYEDMQYELIHKYHVDTETFAIHKVEHLEFPISGKYVGIEHPYPGDTLFYSKKGWNQVTEFEEYQGEMFLKYQNVSYAFDIVDEKNNRIYLDIACQFSFIVTAIETNFLKPAGEKMNRNKPLTLQGDYSATFWNDPSNAQLVPLTKKQIDGLEAEQPLEVQFRTKKSQIKTKLMKAVLLIFLCTLSVYLLCGQEVETISGKIIDVETKAPLAFATVNIQNSPKGVVANEAGLFSFNFPIEHVSDTIVFSFAGYQPEKLLAQALVDSELTIELVKKSVMLTEVVVTNKELTAWQILELALDNIKVNYPGDPFEFKAFYRDYKQENDRCISIFEAAISAYDKGYSKVAAEHVFKEKVVLEQVRKSLSVDYKTHAFKRVNIIKELLKLNDVRYQSRALRKKNNKIYTYELAGYEIINERLMYKIKAKEDWAYFIYVDAVTYAIPRIEMDFEWKEGVDENTWTLFDTIRYNQTSATMLMDFQLINGLYYPRYCSFSSNLEAFDAVTDEALFTSYLLQEYMVTDIDFDPDSKPKKPTQMNPYEMIENQSTTYDPEFWSNYNVLQLHPRNAALIKGLEEQMKLDEQFASDHQ